MGIFDFIKDAGASVFGGDDDVQEPTKPLSQHLKDHGISPEGLKFGFSNEKVTVSGNVASQEAREKIVTIIGNVKGVAAVEDLITVGAPAPGPAADAPAAAAEASEAPAGADWTSRTYTVQPGDTLGKIAREMYGNAARYTKIFEANTPMLKDPNKIYPGQVLRIPELND